MILCKHHTRYSYLEKSLKKQKYFSRQCPLLDYQHVYDTPSRTKQFKAMNKFGILKRLIELYQMFLKDEWSSV